MTRNEEIAELQKRISSQSRNHKTRSGLTHRLMLLRLNQLREEAMSYRAESPEVLVDQTLYALRKAIGDLRVQRETHFTADQVLANHQLISACAAELDGIASDIHLAVHKEAAE